MAYLTPIPWAFLAASLVIAVTPGPGVFYIVTRSVTQGRPAGLASVAGVALGNLGNGIAASFGLAALFAVSTIAFAVVKYVGAAYLIYLGVRTIRSRPSANSEPDATASDTPAFDNSAPNDAPASEVRPPSPDSLKRIFTDGFLVALFNPKTAIFFAAFVPQFVEASTATPVGVASLSVVFVLIAATTDSIYALMAGIARKWLVGKYAAVQLSRFFSGGAFIALGVFTAVSGRKVSS